MGPFKDLAFVLYNASSTGTGIYFIVILMVCLVLAFFFSRLYFFTDLIICYIVINISQRLYATVTGGDFLLNQFLIFNCFLSASFSSTASTLNSCKIFLHNMSVVATITQMCLVYLLAGLAKLNDPSWFSGEAVIAVSQTDHYTLHSFLRYSDSFKFLFVFLNYLVLFYQLFFSFLVWIPRIKKPMLIIGILSHLYIAFVMGLVSFGLLLVIPYIYFWPFKRTVT